MTPSGILLFVLISCWGTSIIAQLFPFLKPRPVERSATVEPITLNLLDVQTRYRHYASRSNVAKRQWLSPVPQNQTSTALNGTATAVTIDGLQEQDALVVSVQIGTPAHEMLVLFDTGQGDTWVQTTVSGYNLSQSSTLATTPYNFNRSFSPDPMSPRLNTSSGGAYFADYVSIGNVSIARQLFVATADTITNVDSAAGVLGAAFPCLTMASELYNISYLPLPFALFHARLVPAPVFSFSIHDRTVMFGGILRAEPENSAMRDDHGPILYTNVTPTSTGLYRGWDIALQAIAVNADSTIHLAPSVPMRIDTATRYLVLPEAIANELVLEHLAKTATRRDEGGYWVECSSVSSSSSSLTLSFPLSSSQKNNNSSNSNTSEFHSLEVNLADLLMVAEESNNNSQESCIVAIEPSTSPSDYAIGTLALKSVVTILDFGLYRVGFSPLNG
ncbi:aspartic peptidase domain-containing protein [Dichotomocladium elegans]|nr:aspartic peptidase domain-containing protein [Dichotomocladium elegans]